MKVLTMMWFPKQNDHPDDDDDIAGNNDAGWGRLSHDNDPDADDDDVAGGNNDAGWLGLSHANVHTGNAVQPPTNKVEPIFTKRPVVATIFPRDQWLQPILRQFFPSHVNNS